MSEFVRDFDLVGRPLIMQVNVSDAQLLPVQWGVPTGRLWCVHTIMLRLTTTAVVGQRRLQLELESTDDDNMHRRHVGVEQPENETRSYHWGLHLPLETAFVQSTGELYTQMPPMWMGVNRDGVLGGGSDRSNMTILDVNSIDGNDSVRGLMVAITEYKDNPNERSVIALEPNI